MLTKVCTKCGKEKELDAFCKCYSNKYGRYSICKECVNWNHRTIESQAAFIEKEELFEQNKKKCPICGDIKELIYFRKSKSRKDGVRPYCIECENVKSRERDNRPDVKKKRHDRDKLPHVKQNRRIYRKGSIKFQETQRKYENSPKRKLQSLEYGRRLEVKIGKRLRCRIYHAIKNQLANKEMPFDEHLGCSIEFFMKYIESLWQEGMSWDNYTHKGWHLDHIRPCASYNLTDIEQQRQCFSYKNLQPLWAEDNLSKGSRYNGELIRKTVKG